MILGTIEVYRIGHLRKIQDLILLLYGSRRKKYYTTDNETCMVSDSFHRIHEVR